MIIILKIETVASAQDIVFYRGLCSVYTILNILDITIYSSFIHRSAISTTNQDKRFVLCYLFTYFAFFVMFLQIMHCKWAEMLLHRASLLS